LRHSTLLGFAALLGFDTLAQVCFKYAAIVAAPLTLDLAWLMRAISEPWLFGAIAGYIGAFFTWITLLERTPIGPAFAASHLEVISVLVLSAALFDEHIGLPQISGCAAIVLGILCLAVDGSKKATAAP
jgi:drug/metabolite transporter (DMT)-like permease